MIFRAVFWIGLVSLLAPHEQEFGLGRPGVDTVLSSSPPRSSPTPTVSRGAPRIVASLVPAPCSLCFTSIATPNWSRAWPAWRRKSSRPNGNAAPSFGQS